MAFVALGGANSRARAASTSRSPLSMPGPHTVDWKHAASGAKGVVSSAKKGCSGVIGRPMESLRPNMPATKAAEKLEP